MTKRPPPRVDGENEGKKTDMVDHRISVKLRDMEWLIVLKGLDEASEECRKLGDKHLIESAEKYERLHDIITD